MAQKNIKIFARIKPERHNKRTMHEIHQNDSKEELAIYPPRDVNQGINNTPYKYTFSFDKIFKPDCDQLQIFQEVAGPILSRVKMGSNGTIFAYGQTGSGKTFTMMGSILPNSYRGIIPRILQNLFNDKSTMRITLSYLEIYKDVGVDLLSRKCQKVTLQEDDKGMHLKLLQKVYVQSMTEAMKILRIGEENRKISCTRYNTRSSRSHCILTIRYEGSYIDRVVQSYIHLVDLAGSERLKAHLRATEESIHINKSLHFLEAVVNALTHPTTRHIPYRNSLVTSVLKDSLNANSTTYMIATLSMAETNAYETLSSCRFASRMSRIKCRRTNVEKETKVDRKAQMLSLQDEVKRLHGLLVKDSQVRQEPYENELTDEDKRYCEVAVTKFLSEDNDASRIPVTDGKHIQECFRIIRKRVKQFQKEAVDESGVKMDRIIGKRYSNDKDLYRTTYADEYSQKRIKDDKIQKNSSTNREKFGRQFVNTNLIIPNNAPTGTDAQSKLHKKSKVKARNDIINFDEYIPLKTLGNQYNNHASIFVNDKIDVRKSRSRDDICAYRAPNSRTKKEKDPALATKTIVKTDTYQSNIPKSQKMGQNKSHHSCTCPNCKDRNQHGDQAYLNHNITRLDAPLPSRLVNSAQRQLQNTRTQKPRFSSVPLINNYPCYKQQDCMSSSPEMRNWNVSHIQTCRSTHDDNNSIIYTDIADVPFSQEESRRIVQDEVSSQHNISHNVENRQILMKGPADLYTHYSNEQNIPREVLNNSPTSIICDDNTRVQPERQEPMNYAKNAVTVNFDEYVREQSKLNAERPRSNYFIKSINSTNIEQYISKDMLVSKGLTNAEPIIRSINTNPFINDTAIEPQIIQNDSPNRDIETSNHHFDTSRILNKIIYAQPYEIPWKPNITPQDLKETTSPRKNIFAIDQSSKHYVLPGTDSKIPLTGDKEIDEEIIKFYKCRELAKITKIS